MSYPKMIVLEMVFECNSHCPNCPYEHSAIRKSYRDTPYMLPSVFERIVDESAGKDCLLRFTGGGEPLMHPRILDYIKLAKKHGLKCGLITNGQLLNSNVVDVLLKSNVDMIEISVDAGTEKDYRYARNGLNWQFLNENIRYLVSARASTRSSSKIIVSAINQVGVDIDKVKEHWDFVDNIQIRKFLTWDYVPEMSANKTPFMKRGDPCPFLYDRLSIDTRGDVTYCNHDIAFSYKYANIKKRSIENIWNGSELSELRWLHEEGRGAEFPLCRDCDDWQYRAKDNNYFEFVRKTDEKMCHNSK